MTTKELMVGNLVRLNNPMHRKDDNGKILSVLQIQDEAISCFPIIDLPCAFCFGQLIKYIEPIQLTHEIIKALGFTIEQKQVSLNVGGELFEYAINDTLVIWYNKSKGFTLDSVVRAKDNPRGESVYYNSVHEIQNLFFALKKRELEIDVKKILEATK
jgi:hypothetical protein